jgi:hypothetical protein
MEKTELVGKPKGKRPRNGWEDNIKTNIRGRGCDDMHCTHTAKNREKWRDKQLSASQGLCSTELREYF